MQQGEREKTPAFAPSPSFPEPPTEEVEATQKISAALSAESDDHGPAVNDEEDEEFEFAFVLGDSETGPVITADEIFSDGKIRPVYPFFSRDLLLLLPDGGGGGGDHSTAPPPEDEKKKAVRLTLRRLLIEEREAEPSRSSSLSSSSSAELNELEGIPPDSYCVWTPRGAAQSPGRCRKSSSTGAPLRWRLRDLVVRRNHSEGKEKFVFVAAEEKKDKSTMAF